jgi:CheY-like chemotaxis protein
MAALQTAPIDVLVTDVNLPGVSGPELAARARELRPAVGIVFATGDASGIASPAAAVTLVKPYGLAAMKRAIADAIGARTAKDELAR